MTASLQTPNRAGSYSSLRYFFCFLKVSLIIGIWNQKTNWNWCFIRHISFFRNRFISEILLFLYVIDYIIFIKIVNLKFKNKNKHYLFLSLPNLFSFLSYAIASVSNFSCEESSLSSWEYTVHPSRKTVTSRCSLCSCSRIGLRRMGEKPRARTPIRQ